MLRTHHEKLKHFSNIIAAIFSIVPIKSNMHLNILITISISQDQLIEVKSMSIHSTQSSLLPKPLRIPPPYRVVVKIL